MLTELCFRVYMYMCVCVLCGTSMCIQECVQRYVLELCRRPKENTGHPLFCPPSPFPLGTGSLNELGACHFSGEAGSQRVPAILLSLYPTPSATLLNTCVTVPSFLTWVLGTHTQVLTLEWQDVLLTGSPPQPPPNAFFIKPPLPGRGRMSFTGIETSAITVTIVVYQRD